MKKRAKGILLCFLLAAFAWLLVAFIPKLEVIGAPILAILTGMILMPFLKATSNLSDGIGFTSKKILQYAVILLGFGLNLNTIKSVGLLSLPIILSTISVSLLVSYILHKLMKIPAKTSTLIGVGSSICGGSAIAATAPVIGADDEEIAQAISVIFLFNVVAALIFPALGTILGLSNTGFGLFAGTAINDTSSVTAAASTWDTLHGTNGSVLAYATIVKLTRTLAIIPITLVLSFVRMRGERKNNINQQGKISIKGVFPLFILYFIIASLITTVITSTCSGASLKIAETIFAHIKQLSKFFIVMAMAAIGLNTSLKKLIKNGPKPIILGFCCWVSIATVSIALQKLLHIL